MKKAMNLHQKKRANRIKLKLSIIHGKKLQLMKKEILLMYMRKVNGIWVQLFKLSHYRVNGKQ